MPEVNLRRYRGRYAAVWYDEAGNRQRRFLGTPDRTLAETRRLALAAQLGAAVPAGTLTVAKIFAAYITDRTDEGKSVERIEYAWKRLGPHFGHFRPADITKVPRQRWHDMDRAWLSTQCNIVRWLGKEARWTVTATQSDVGNLAMGEELHLQIRAKT
jgi:hypothetical protein